MNRARTVLEEAAATDTYEHLKRQTFKQVWWYVQHTGMDLDDSMSVANEAFAWAYSRYDPEMGTQLNTYLWHVVRGRLLNQKPTRLKTNTLDRPCGKEENMTHARSLPDRAPSGLGRLLSEVGEDARLIIGLVVDDPDALASLTGSQQPERWRKALWNRLRKLGWGMGRAGGAFSEIRDALT